jgi:uncharacterized protein
MSDVVSTAPVTQTAPPSSAAESSPFPIDTPGRSLPAGEASAAGEQATATTTYLLVDGENIDATLGISVLGHRPEPDERPRWERVLDFTTRTFGQPVKALFFLNVSNGYVPMTFVQALLAMDYRPVPLAGRSDQKVVDIGIQKMMDVLVDRPANVMLASHDGDFLSQTRALLSPSRRVGLLGLREYVNLGFADLVPSGLEVYDLEEDVACFRKPLPRTRIINVDDFDPLRFL